MIKGDFGDVVKNHLNKLETKNYGWGDDFWLCPQNHNRKDKIKWKTKY